MAYQHHVEECESVDYEGAPCTCDLIAEYGSHYETTVYGEDASNYDGRTHGPALDY
ncbi:hypothetical protein AB0H17_27175 [Streptomyces olivoreticuli]